MTDEQAAAEALAGFVELDDGQVPAPVAEAFASLNAESRQALVEGRRRQEEQRPVTVEAIPALVIRPGDVLLVSVPSTMTLAQADAIKVAAMERMPGLADVVVFGGGTVAGVYREEQP